MTKNTNKNSSVDKIDLAAKVGVDGTASLVTAFAAAVALSFAGLGTAPVSIPLALGAGIVGGVVAHLRTFGTPKS